MSTTRTRAGAPDELCAEAVELARGAAAEAARPYGVGPHLGLDAEAERVVTHFFDCLDPAYRGWRWAITVMRAARAKVVTVGEIALLPGTGALLAPDWVPWLERLRPGDLGVGDLLPTAPDDIRLVPGLTLVDDDGDHVLAWELGLGRARVLSVEGRDEATERWYAGNSGPHAPLAHAAPAHCATCGFYVPLSGALKQLFGVCANRYAPDDGHVVALDHGCGAHSEAMIPALATEPPPPIIDELGYDVVEQPAAAHERGEDRSR